MMDTLSGHTELPELSIHDVNALCQHYLNIVYHDISDKIKPCEKGAISEKDGEILYSGVNKLLSMMSLTEQDVFLDLGSGAGKVVAQIFLTSRVKEAWGIEIRPGLHQQAVAAAERIQHEAPDFYFPNRILTFSQDDFFTISLARATVVLINSVCFTQPMLQRLGHIIDHTSGIRAVLTSRPITTMQRLSFKKAMRVECTWDTALWYVYQSHAK